MSRDPIAEDLTMYRTLAYRAISIQADPVKCNGGFLNFVGTMNTRDINNV